MKLIFQFIFVLMFLPGSVTGQNYSISGFIKDALSEEPLVSAVVYFKATGKYVISNKYGFYSIIPENNIAEFEVTYVGCKRVSYSVRLENDTIINIYLEPELNIEEVVVKESSQKSIINNNIHQMQIKQINSLPAIGCEPDVLKAAQTLPGIQGGSEGSVGLHVRGGDPGQNLYLLDGVPVYNPNHMFGFFSVFNPDAIKDIKIMKGGFSAKYGGRISSVVDITMKEGNKNKISGNAGVGLIASKFTLEGPVVKEQTSFIVSARRTYVDLFAKPIVENFTEYNSANYYFYDLSAKLSHNLSKNGSISISWYQGKDEGASEEMPEYSDNSTVYKKNAVLSNQIGALNWSYRLSNNLFADVAMNFSKYKTKNSNEDEFTYNTGTYSVKFNNSSEVSNYFGKAGFDYYLKNNQISFGISNSIYKLYPDITTYQVKQTDLQTDTSKTVSDCRIKTYEYSAYIQDDILVNSKLKMNIGLRYVMFLNDKTSYHRIEPRFSLSYRLSPILKTQIDYSHMNQSLHLLTMSKLNLTSDIWLPSTAEIKPQNSQQISTGLSFNRENSISAMATFFYKKIKNVSDYADGTSFFRGFSNWDEIVAQGQAKSYGIEILATKDYGKITGQIAYTLSKSERIFDDINYGRTFPYKYNRQHLINAVANYKITELLQLSLLWTYGTGSYSTIPLEEYIFVAERGIGGTGFYIEKNNFRLPAYHRMDISIRWEKNKKKNKSTWVLSIYNVYNRKNIYYVSVRPEVVNGEPRPYIYKEALFPIIPSLSYQYSF